jgi:ribosomal protein S12 methylthiotransferase
VFTYSPEEGTAAFDLASPVPKKTAVERLDRLMKTQAKISLKKNTALIGTRQRVLIDGMEDMALIGRLQTQAPEIDGVVYLSETEAAPGEFVEAMITDATEYDLMGQAEGPDSEAGSQKKEGRRKQ